LGEVPTGASTPVPPPVRVADTESTPRPRRWPFLAAGAALAIAAAVFFVARGGNKDPLDAAREELDAGRARDALQTVDGLEKSGTPVERLAGLRAAAQHVMHDHEAEMRSLWAARSSDSVLDVRPLRALTEDLAHQGGEGPPKDFLDGLPPARTTAALKGIAESGTTDAAWGALRYLDRQHRTDTLDLVGVYGAWLESSDCTARTAAARRLGELGRPEAVAILQKAKKRKMPHGCGQDEIAGALRALDRP